VSVSCRKDGSTFWGTLSNGATRLNRQLRGWANYFCLGPVSKWDTGATNRPQLVCATVANMAATKAPSATHHPR
jgi:hypothetical protein